MLRSIFVRFWIDCEMHTCQLCNDSTGNTQPLSQYKPEPKISRPHRTQPTMMSHEHNSIGGSGTCEDQAMAPHLLPAAHPNRFLRRHMKTSSSCSDLQLLPSSVHRTIIPERSGSMKTTAASGTANGQPPFHFSLSYCSQNSMQVRLPFQVTVLFCLRSIWAHMG